MKKMESISVETKTDMHKGDKTEEMKAERRGFYKTADADGNGLLNQAEMMAYYNLIAEASKKKYGEGVEFTEDDMKVIYEAQNKISEGEGCSMTDMCKMRNIFAAWMKE